MTRPIVFAATGVGVAFVLGVLGWGVAFEASPGGPGPLREHGSRLRASESPGCSRGASERGPTNRAGARVVAAAAEVARPALARPQLAREGPGSVVGAIERVDAREISGFAYVWDQPDLPALVDVFVDGKLVASLVARDPRRALAASAPANVLEARGWRCPAPPELGDGDEHRVVVLGSTPGSPAKHPLAGSPWEHGGVRWPRAEILDASAHCVFGWAVDPEAPGSPVTVELLADGKPIAKLRTSPGRNEALWRQAYATPDVPADLVRPGDDVQAFIYAPRDPIPGSWLQVRVSRADGSLAREAERSPWQIGSVENRIPFGAVAFVNDAQISGYAVDPDAAPGAISVDVFVDGARVARIPADKTFAALPTLTTVREPTHAFTFSPPDRYRDGKAHSVQFFAVNEPEGPNPELQGSPVTFVGKRRAAPYGWLESAGPEGASGWAYVSGAVPVQVEVWLDDVLVSTSRADARRPDLVPFVASDPGHGFATPLPAAIGDGRHHVVRAFALELPGGPKQELAGSPREINADGPFMGVSVREAAIGLVVESVAGGSPAQAAGVVAGDVIRSFDGTTRAVDAATFEAWARTKEVGETVVLRLWRDPSELGLSLPGAAPSLGPGERLARLTVGGQ